MRNPRKHVKYLLAVTGTLALLSLTSWVTLRSYSSRWPAPSDFSDKANSSNLTGQLVSVSTPTEPDRATQAQVKEAYGQLPLSFEANQGQTDARVKFLSRGSGYTLFLTPTETVLTLRGGQRSGARGQVLDEKLSSPAPDTRHPVPAVVRMQLVGANSAPPVAGVDELPGKSNYFIGKDPEKWRTNIAHYGKVRYAGVYPGVDLVYYGNQGQLEYDFVVSAGADPRAIKLTFAGAREVRLVGDGELLLGVGGGEIRQHKPVIYQEVEGVKKEIAGGYRIERIEGQNQVSFEVGRYDESRELVIDPVLVYSTYLGGSGGEGGNGIAVDEAGNAYVTGNTNSPDFPTTPGAFDTTFNGLGDAFVTKLNRSGTALVYSTYLDGSLSDAGRDIAVDGARNAYVTGQTNSPDFPTTPGAFYTTYNGGSNDAFVTKLNRSGTALVYSTYLGGISDDFAVGIAVDSAANAYVTGITDSLAFPTTPGAFDTAYNGGSNDAFVTKFNRTGSALVYSTYLGGIDRDRGFGIAVDDRGRAYVTGETRSADFPTTPGGFDTTLNAGITDAFVTKLNRRGSALVYSTYIGGSDNDFCWGIAVDDRGRAYVTGNTRSADFPTTPGAFDTTFNGSIDAFVTKLNRRGSALVYSTYLGGSGDEEEPSIVVDKEGNAYVIGDTESADFPTTPGAFDTTFNAQDAFVTKLTTGGDDDDDDGCDGDDDDGDDN